MMADKYLVTHPQSNRNRHQFIIHLGETKLVISTLKDMVSVNLKIGNTTAALEDFGSSVGLIGQLTMTTEDGAARMLDRHGARFAEDDFNAYGQAWQVLDTEPKLFSNPNVHPQFPTPCVFPDAKSSSRRLGQSSISELVAEEACSQWTEEMRSYCIYDVLATGELEAADLFGAF